MNSDVHTLPLKLPTFSFKGIQGSQCILATERGERGLSAVKKKTLEERTFYNIKREHWKTIYN